MQIKINTATLECFGLDWFYLSVSRFSMFFHRDDYPKLGRQFFHESSAPWHHRFILFKRWELLIN
ncbi:hypothetical protein [uncultured Propionivibrio sp.]|uniref:hypothetical protein n=1 Tax=uncultured Propionivibrio sp. TaxID=426737 RepID=UPI0029C06C15|nr:hypothetical protein [uncultured Propionivibrio sp.]